jgi:hypothetical protein
MGLPVSSSSMTQPSAYTSDAGPNCPVRMYSGSMYAWAPASTWVVTAVPAAPGIARALPMLPSLTPSSLRRCDLKRLSGSPAGGEVCIARAMR